MERVAVRLDRSMFNDDVVARTAHRYTGRFFVAITTQEDHFEVTLDPRPGSIVHDDLEKHFLNDALDERLRAIVRSETADLHHELIRAALREAAPSTQSLE